MDNQDKPWVSSILGAKEMYDEIVLHHTAKIIHTAVEKGFSDEAIAEFLDISVEGVQETHNLSRQILGQGGF